MSKKGIIISGGFIDDVFALKQIAEINPDYVIGVDSGLSFLYRNQIEPTHIVGDFDSVEPEVITYYKEKATIPVRQFNPVKDSTDTEIAMHLAVELGVETLWVIGATGTRLDHVMANIQILKIALDHGIRAYLLDEYNRISLWEKEICLSKKETFGTYFSLFPLGGAVEDVSIEGAKYPLLHYRVNPYDSRCVSNEVEGDVRITFPEGILILMETTDR